MSLVLAAAAVVFVVLIVWRRAVAEMKERRVWAAKRQFENAKNASSPRSIP